ncbi:hypothetical protein A3Q56_01354 [Intoshia linei]|uniref:Uncharacterized protein n=1 Tax=Intoshia linei TaxID=1819745 RepID=A0A177BB65_9BILA|nr:hypothetical protein A3Q56_01354 [Intoshia linei]
MSTNIIFQDINRCHNSNLKYIKNCTLGYTYFGGSKKKDCYVFKNDLHAKRNIKFQCISQDYICAYGYTKYYDTNRCEKLSNRGKRNAVCLDGKVVSIDIKAYLPVYDNIHYLKYCAADIFNPKSVNISCRGVYQHVPSLIKKYQTESDDRSKGSKSNVYIIVGTSISAPIILAIFIFIFMKCKGYSFT